MLYKKLLILCAILSLSSCDILKESQKTKRDIQANATEKVTVKNSGGSITSDILPEKERPKDAQGKIKDTIVVVKKDEITKTIYYKPDGSVRTTVECPDTFITEERTLDLIDQSKEKESTKEESFQSEIIIYFMLGLAVIFCCGLFIFMWQARKQTEGMSTIAKGIEKVLLK
jgi:ATP-dependent Zn protease